MPDLLSNWTIKTFTFVLYLLLNKQYILKLKYFNDYTELSEYPDTTG